MDHAIEFSVWQVEGKQEDFSVLGRCLEQEIRIGDVFDAIYRYSDKPSAERMQMCSDPYDVRAVALRVEAIEHIPGRLEAVLHPGYGARLRLSGKGRASVHDGDVLGTMDRATCPYARTSEESGTAQSAAVADES